MSSPSGRHPCYDAGAHTRFARLHLPVASRCNIRCGYCDRKHDCVNESRPGVTSTLLSPDAALALTARAVQRMPDLTVVGIAGPGDPLASADATLRTFGMVRREFPHLLLCLSTNGLVLPLHVDALCEIGVEHVTVTVNAVSPVVGERLVTAVHDGGAMLCGQAGAALLWQRQRQGLAMLKAHGVSVKVNTVVVPGVNDTHVVEIASRIADLGVDVMNCIAQIPVAGTPLGGGLPPSSTLMESIRAAAGLHLPQMRHCARCRADAAGRLAHGTTIVDLDLLDRKTSPDCKRKGEATAGHVSHPPAQNRAR